MSDTLDVRSVTREFKLLKVDKVCVHVSFTFVDETHVLLQSFGETLIMVISKEGLKFKLLLHLITLYITDHLSLCFTHS